MDSIEMRSSASHQQSDVGIRLIEKEKVMKVEELIKQLMDCRGDADVFTASFDISNELSRVSGVSNEGNSVVIFNNIAWNSPRALQNKQI